MKKIKIYKKFFGKNIYLEKINKKNLSKDYKKWLNDIENLKFMEFRFVNITNKNINIFLNNMIKSKNDYFFGIFIKKKNTHIGNIKIGNIDFNHQSAEIGFMLGEKIYRNKGVMTEALKIVTFICFTKLKLKYICGYVYEKNIASIKVFKKNKFKLSGVFKKKVFFNNKRINVLCYERNY
jgi:RimJ/RimL family protein N-acetyltransferase